METKNNVTVLNALKAGAISGVASLVLNNIWNVIIVKTTGVVAPIITPVSISMSSFLTAVIGGLVFWGLAKFLDKASLIFVVLAAILGVLSCYGNIQPTLPDGSVTPDGFALLTIPMHLIAAAVAAYVIPKYSK